MSLERMLSETPLPEPTKPELLIWNGSSRSFGDFAKSISSKGYEVSGVAARSDPNEVPELHMKGLSKFEADPGKSSEISCMRHGFATH